MSIWATRRHHGTAFHSTLQLGDVQQGETRTEWLFGILSLSHPEDLECRAAAGPVKYRGLLRGYARSAEGALHTQTLTLHEDRGRLTIDDHVSGSFQDPAALSFQLDPSVSAS